ncbi:MAG TPA: PA2779 family protein [Gammaproteobacteria bacterium]|nr:PA2779 family protein [Gammaproteobacteria bacterium]
MTFLRRHNRIIAGMTLAVFGVFSIWAPAAQAGAIGTEALLAAERGAAARATVATQLERASVRAELLALGVDPAVVEARLDTLTDEELVALAEQIETLPAGADSLIGALVFVFIVLLITDLLGYTDVFPFVKKQIR